MNDSAVRNAGVFTNDPFRECPELGAEDGGNGETAALRCFGNDGSGELAAGLYPTDIESVEDHWAHGDMVTTRTDAALARDRAGSLGGRPESQVGVLLGIAVERLRRRPRVYATVRIPTRLKRWRVRTRIASREGEAANVTVDVYADCAETARTVAGATVLHEAIWRSVAQPELRDPAWRE